MASGEVVSHCQHFHSALVLNRESAPRLKMLKSYLPSQSREILNCRGIKGSLRAFASSMFIFASMRCEPLSNFSCEQRALEKNTDGHVLGL